MELELLKLWHKDKARIFSYTYLYNLKKFEKKNQKIINQIKWWTTYFIYNSNFSNVDVITLENKNLLILLFVFFFLALSLTRKLFQIDWLCLFKGELITSTCYLIIIAMGKCFTTKQTSFILFWYNYLKLLQHNDFKIH